MVAGVVVVDEGIAAAALVVAVAGTPSETPEVRGLLVVQGVVEVATFFHRWPTAVAAAGLRHPV